MSFAFEKTPNISLSCKLVSKFKVQTKLIWPIKQKALCVYNKKGIPNVWTWVSFKYS